MNKEAIREALKQWVEEQEGKRAFFICIADADDGTIHHIAGGLGEVLINSIACIMADDKRIKGVFSSALMLLRDFEKDNDF